MHFSRGCWRARVLDEKGVPPEGVYFVEDYPVYYDRLYFLELHDPLPQTQFWERKSYLDLLECSYRLDSTPT